MWAHRYCLQGDLFLLTAIDPVQFVLKVDGHIIAYLRNTVIIFQGMTYSSTVRTSGCEWLVKGNKCEACRSYRSVLRAMASRNRKNSGSETERTCPSSHVNYRYLSSTEKDKRMANLHTELAKERRQVALLREKVKKLNEEKGVQVDQELSDDLSGIINDMTGQVESQHPEDSFQRVFWNQQLQAMKVHMI